MAKETYTNNRYTKAAKKANGHSVAAMQDTLDAYRLGKQDARAGELCLPELYFTRRDQRVAYCHGHVEVAGKTLLAYQMLGWSQS